MYALPVTLAAGIAVGGAGGSGAQAASLFPLFPNVEQVRTLQPSGSSFEQQLAKEYKGLALFEADEMGDWTEADLFAEKGLRASDGGTPTPSGPAVWGIGRESTASELTSARRGLVGLLDAGGPTGRDWGRE